MPVTLVGLTTTDMQAEGKRLVAAATFAAVVAVVVDVPAIIGDHKAGEEDWRWQHPRQSKATTILAATLGIKS